MDSIGGIKSEVESRRKCLYHVFVAQVNTANYLQMQFLFHYFWANAARRICGYGWAVDVLDIFNGWNKLHHQISLDIYCAFNIRRIFNTNDCWIISMLGKSTWWPVAVRCMLYSSHRLNTILHTNNSSCNFNFRTTSNARRLNSFACFCEPFGVAIGDVNCFFNYLFIEAFA